MGIQRKEKGKDDYSEAFAYALTIIQELAGKRWTDFNPHDPGVTMLDVFCYGILDIQYRLDLDFFNYVPHDSDGNIDFESWGLHPSEVLFAEATVTPQDYAALVERSVPAIRACEVEWTAKGYRFCIALHNRGAKEEAIQAVKALFYRNRSLNECLYEVVENDGLATRHQRPPNADDMPLHDVPSAERRLVPLADYKHKSLQYDMPAIYALGQEGPPPHADVAHKAYILQLKGFMLLVDYLFSSVDQQLQSIPTLMGRTHFRRPVFAHVVEIADLDHLLDDTASLRSVYDPLMDIEKRLSFAKMCCALYGENPDELLQLMRVNFEGAALAERFATVARWLPEWQKHRAKGMDILPPRTRTMPMIKRFLTAVMGQDSVDEDTMANRMAGWKLLGEDDFNQRYRHVYPWHELPLGSKIYKVPVIDMSEERSTRVALAGGDLLGMKVLPEWMLSIDRLPDKCRIALSHGMYSLYCKGAGHTKWLRLGQSKSSNRIIEYANALWAAIKELRARALTCYFIEHALLPADGDTHEAARITIIMPDAWKNVYGQQNLEEWLRSRLPASLLVVFKWLTLQQFVEFEPDYLRWKDAFQQPNPSVLVQAANPLKRWL